MHLPNFLRYVNRVVTNPILGTFAWLIPPMAVIHHRGRKSGKAYRTPVVAFPTRGGFVVPMTYRRDVDWARNLQAAGGGAIVRLGRRHPVVNPRIGGEEIGRAHLPWPVRPLLLAMRLPGFMLLDRA
jgi:deazaflavin-dependent oxidoreductase (nitroreductase family)